MKNPYSNGSFLKKWVMPNNKTMEYILKPQKFNVTEGPIRSAKTSDNILSFCIEIEKSPDMVHGAIGVTQSSAKAILFDGDGLGIQHYPDWQERVQIINGVKKRFKQRIFLGKYKGNDCLILIPKEKSKMTVKYIVAFGGNTKISHEPYKGYSFGMVIATQWELLHKKSRNEVLKRTALSRHRMHFIDLNPTDPHHDVYKKLEIWQKNDGVNYIKKLMMDNPIMTDARMAEILSEYDPNSISFKRDILGERAIAEGLIYTVREENILQSINWNDYHSYVIVADPGENASATAFVLVGITKGFANVDVLMEYGHRNFGLSGLTIKMPFDYAIDYIDFIKASKTFMKKPPNRVFSDLDLTFMREYERNKAVNGVSDVLHNAIKEEIATRIKTGINLLYKGRLRFYKDCTWSINSFKTAIYDPKQSEKGIFVRYDNPVEGTMIDHCDAIEYAISSYKYELSLFRG